MARIFQKCIGLGVRTAIALAAAVACAAAAAQLAPAPTPDNASPPPEAFYIAAGALIGFSGAWVLTWLLPAIVSGWRRRSGNGTTGA